MKNQNKKKLLVALPVLLAIAMAPAATGNVFAQNADVDVSSDIAIDVAPSLGRDATPSDTPDRKAEVKFRGGTDGWALIGGQAYVSDIAIEGNAIHQGKGVWNIASEAKIAVDERHATLDLKGKAHNGKIRLHGSGTLDTGEPFRIFLRGHYAPIADSPGDFVLAFSAAKIQNMENGIKIPLIQHGIIHVEPVHDSADYAEFLKDFDVQ